MYLLFFLLTIVCLINLVTGLVKPMFNFFNKKIRNRKAILLVYGSGSIFFLLLSIVTVDTRKNSTVINDKEDIQPIAVKLKEVLPFEGMLVYEVSEVNGDEKGVKTFKDLAAQKIELKFAKDKYSQQEFSGWNEGKIIGDWATNSFFFLDTVKRTFVTLTARDVGKEFEKIAAEEGTVMSNLSDIELQATNETATICGYKTKAYIVKKSSFFRTPDAKAKIWVTEQLYIPLSLYDFQSEWKRINSPLMVSMNIRKGAILKMKFTDKGVTVVYVATKVQPQKLAADHFKVPANYKEYKE